MATSGLDGQMKIWDVRTYKQLQAYYTPTPASCLAISQRGLLAVGHGPNIQVWCLVTVQFIGIISSLLEFKIMPLTAKQAFRLWSLSLWTQYFRLSFLSAMKQQPELHLRSQAIYLFLLRWQFWIVMKCYLVLLKFWATLRELKWDRYWKEPKAISSADI